MIMMWLLWNDEGQSQNSALQSELMGGKNIRRDIWHWQEGRQDDTMWRYLGYLKNGFSLFSFPFTFFRKNPYLKTEVKKSVKQE